MSETIKNIGVFTEPPAFFMVSIFMQRIGAEVETKSFMERLKDDRMIAAIKDPKSFDRFIESDLQSAFLLMGNISVIKRYVDKLKKHDRHVFLHIEKIQELATTKKDWNSYRNS